MKSLSPADEPRRSFPPAGFWLALIVALGFILRLYKLGYTSLWMDELDIYWHSSIDRDPWVIFTSTLRECFQNETNEHMPMQYVLLNLFLRAYHGLGIADNNFLIRLPFALFGALTVPLVYVVAREFYDRRAGLWSAFVVAASFFHVYQSRDATSYGPMLFFQTLNIYGLLGWVFPEGRPKASFIRRGLCLVAGSMGVLSCHLTSWFFLSAEGLIVTVWFVLVWFQLGKGPKPEGFHWMRTPLGAMVLIAASTIRFIAVPFRAMTYFKPPGTGEGAEAAHINWEFMSYEFAHFGWGRGHGRLVVLFIVLAVGLWMVFRERATRRRYAFHLAMIAVPFLFLFLAPHAVVFPRYLSLCFIPFAVLVGRGLQGAASMGGRLREGSVGLAVGLVALVACMLANPYRTLFKMSAKLMPYPEIAAWVTNHVPPGGMYVWQSGYNLREIPKAYPIPDRQPAYATLNSGSILAPAAAAKWGPFARDLFQRFPLAVLLATDFPEPPLSEYWHWLGTDFAHRTSVVNRALAELNVWGFSHSGILDPANDEIYFYWNTPDDVVQRARAAGRSLVGWPEGAGWRYLQTEQHVLLAALPKPALCRVQNLAANPVQAKLVFRVAAQADGSLRVGIPGADEANTLTVGFQRSNGMTLEVGPVTLQPGENVLQLRQVPSDQLALLVFSMEVAPFAGTNDIAPSVKE